MPRGDGTGPEGKGKMTGRAAGYCSGSKSPGFQTPGPRQGLGRALGNGLRRLLGGRRGRPQNNR
jgi:hypothetical protein